MPLYETVLIARNDVTQQQVEQIADEIGAELETDGGAVKKREYWGLRGLAYRIKKNRKGHYMLLGLDAKPAFITEMERKLGLNEDVLRFMTIRVEAKSRRRRPPSCPANPMTASAASAVPSPPDASKAAAAAALTTVRNSAPATTSAGDDFRASRGVTHHVR